MGGDKKQSESENTSSGGERCGGVACICDWSLGPREPGADTAAVNMEAERCRRQGVGQLELAPGSQVLSCSH